MYVCFFVLSLIKGAISIKIVVSNLFSRNLYLAAGLFIRGEKGERFLGSSCWRGSHENQQYSGATCRAEVMRPEWLSYLAPLLMAEQRVSPDLTVSTHRDWTTARALRVRNWFPHAQPIWTDYTNVWLCVCHFRRWYWSHRYHSHINAQDNINSGLVGLLITVREL